MLNIRCAVTTDVPLIVQIIRELAEYERAPEQSAAREEVAEIEARIHSTEPQNPRDHQVPLDKFSPGQR